MASFSAATQASQVDSHTYALNFTPEWCIGSVPHGGFVTACIMSAVKLHFSTTLKAQRQPDCQILHLEFPRRTSIGAAVLRIRDIKLGRQISTVQVTLTQNGDRDEVIGYISHADITAESGLSLPTSFTVDPRPPKPDLVQLRATGSDANWKRNQPIMANFRLAAKKVQIFLPRTFNSGRGTIHQCLRFADGERFTNASLGYVCDVGPQIVETYIADTEALEFAGLTPEQLSKHWYPTLALNLDVKKRLPNEGVEFLFVRIRAKLIQKGRMDLEFVVLDEAGELVALSHHVAMIVSAARNLAARRRSDAMGGEGSKL